jgi:hypothetical protein
MKPMKPIFTMLLILLPMIEIRAQPPRAPTKTLHTPTGHPSQFITSVAVNGTKTPERIPDYLAYWHFIMAAAVRQNASPEEFARRRALLSRIGFSQRDADSFVAALSNVREELDSLDEATTGLAAESANSWHQLDNLRAQRHQVLDNAKSRLRNALTLDGWLILDAYVRDHVKRRIVIYGAPPERQDALPE